MNKNYEKAEEAKASIDSFNEAVNLDGLLQIGAREIVAAGNSFWLKTNDMRPFCLKILPLTGFDDPKAIIRNSAGDVQGYKYKFDGVQRGFKPDEIIHWKCQEFVAEEQMRPEVEYIVRRRVRGYRGSG